MGSLFNRMLSESWFPQEWNTSITVPIPKRGKPVTPSNLRPISLLSSIGKIFEKIVLKKLTANKKLMNTIPNNQFGFVRGFSTREPLELLRSNVLFNMTKKKSTAALFLDLSKAYDSVKRKILIKKLQNVLDDSKILNFLEFFLGRRLTRIRINGAKSDCLFINDGVPQGSPLSPLLFNIYAGELLNTRCNSLGYADDLVFFNHGTKCSKILEEMKNDILKVQKIAEELKLKISEEKSSIVIFSNSKESKPTTVQIGNLNFKVTDTTKYLGVTFDKKLTFKKHILEQERKLRWKSSKVEYLLSSYTNIDTKTLLMLFKSHCLSSTDYGCEVGIGTARTNLNTLEALEHKSLTKILGTPRTSSRTEVRALSNFTPIRKRWAFRVLKFLAKTRGEHRDIFSKILSRKGVSYSSKKQSIDAASAYLKNALNNIDIISQISDGVFDTKLAKNLIIQNQRREAIRFLDGINKRKLLRELLKTKLSIYETRRRSKEVSISNLLLDTLPFEKNLKRWGRASSVLCPKCNVPSDSIHGVFICPRFYNLRYELLKQAEITTVESQSQALKEEQDNVHHLIVKIVKQITESEN